MKVLIIILSILLALGILLLSRLRFSLVYDGALRLRVRYLFLKFNLYPRKKRIKKRKNGKRKKPSAVPAEKSAAPHSATASKKKNRERPPLKFRDIRVLFRIFRNVIGRILDKARRHVRLGIRRLHLTIGGERNAALAAIEYGLAVQSTEYLIAYLEETGFFRRPEAGAVNVSVDFLEEGHSLDARIDISCPLVFLAPLVLSSLSSALDGRRKWRHHRRHVSQALNSKNNPSEKEQNNV